MKHCRVVGESMQPTLHEGDLIIYKPIKSKENISTKGSIVIAIDPLKKTDLIIKRVIDESKIGIELRGDNEVLSIDSRKYGLIKHSDLLGVVQAIVPRKTQSKKRRVK